MPPQARAGRLVQRSVLATLAVLALVSSGVCLVGWSLARATEPASDPLLLLETGPQGTRERVLAPDAVVVQGIEGDGETRRVVTEVISDEPERVIVELRSRPLLKRAAIRRLGGLRRGAPEVTWARKQLAAEHARVRSEVVGIAERRRGRAVLRSQVIRREYSKVFNGFAASLSRAEQEEILRLPDVRAVHADPEVRATLDVSTPLIGAPDVWGDYGYTGEGMVIAIIDTGVDYTHPDLGGCIGPGCKVIGGFDFSNNDADPMDDNGHGTHCAGIAAGTHPVLRGVAPGARLLAYKVLNASGSGDGSVVIAGIERAVDPDGDGDTSDRADVISMSLGGQDTEEDSPLTQAAENAIAAGTVVVAAAGNSGGFFTILTPGAAPSVLTVGATDDFDRRASFSSRGPTNRTLLIKPEIAAPGVGICSTRAEGTGLGPTCLDEVHIAISGTSMATPHVSGSAALVRGLAPDLTPAEVKSLLVNNAMELPLGVMEVGAGRVDIPAAAAAHTVLEPATLSFGDSDLTQEIWVVNRTLIVRNRDDAAHSYSLGVTELPEGVQLNLTPSEFSLNSGTSTMVDVELVVNNATVPGVGSLPFAHEGAVLVDSGSQVQRIPFAFMKQPPVLRLEFDVIPIAVMVHNRESFARFIGSPGVPVFDVQVSTGILDVMVLFPNGVEAIRPVWVVREGVLVTGSTSVSISRAEAQHAITHVIRDAEGEPIEPTHKMLTLQYKPTRFAITMFVNGSPHHPNLGFGASDISSDYALGVALRAASGDDDYFLLDGLDAGVASGANLDADPTNMTRLVSRFHPRPGEGPIRVGAAVWRRAGLFASGLAFSRQSSGFERNLYLTPVPRKPFFFSVAPFVSQVARSFPRLTTSHSLEPALTLGTVDLLARPFLSEVVYRNTRGQLPMNLGPFFWHLATDNSPNAVSIRDPIDSIQAPIAFLSQGAGVPEAVPGEGGTVPWELYFGSTLVDSGVLSQTRLPQGWTRTSAQPEGRYRLLARGPIHAVGEATGITQVELTFDTSVPSSGPYDPNPPSMRMLEILREGALTNRLAPDRPVIVAVEVSDDAPNHDSTGIDTVTVTYSTASGGVTVPASHVGEGRYEAAIACDPGLGSLMVVVTDGVGNSQRQEFTPAFSCRFERCGDGVMDFAEQCDDGNNVSCDGCSATCQIDGVCGNGVLERACEQCDDGNTVSCDGCSAICVPEGFCGDGVHDPACEACDDGNLQRGDCCSAICEIEPRFTVCRPPVGACDVLELCSGSSGACPSDLWRPAGTTCRPALSACDRAESCTGSGPHCPGDVLLPDGASCDDRVFCNGPDRCSGGTCSVHEGDPCGVSSECRGCDEGADRCLDPPGGACSDDGNVCTDDVCDGEGSCIHPGNTLPCNDPCTQDGVCRHGQCSPGLIPVICTAVDECHLPGTCNPATGLCSGPPKPDGTGCDDGLRCTSADACMSGVCRGGILPDGDGDGVCDVVDVCADDVDRDADGIGDLCDNCPGDYNPDQRNSDGSGGGDVCDPCPMNGDSLCVHAQSAGKTLGAAGGTVTTPDGKVRIEVPPGALDTPTSVSITETLSEFGGTSSRIVLRTELAPDGQRLDPSGTLTFRWDDADGDGGVDGVAPRLAEEDLRVWRNGVEIAGPCGDPAFQRPRCAVACCDVSANTWTLEAGSFGQYVVGEPVGMWIPGSLAQDQDCILEWEVMDPHEEAAMSEEGVPDSKRTCVDGDFTCDADGEVNASCAFVLSICVNVEDHRYVRSDGAPLCLPSDVERVVLKNPRPSDRRVWKAELARRLLELLVTLGPASVSGTFRPQVTFTPPVAGQLCTPKATLVLPLEGRVQTVLSISARAVTGTPAGYAGNIGGDGDRLVLECRRPE